MCIDVIEGACADTAHMPCARAHKYAYPHGNVHVYTHACAHACAHACTHAYTHVCTQISTIACAHVHTHSVLREYARPFQLYIGSVSASPTACPLRG